MQCEMPIFACKNAGKQSKRATTTRPRWRDGPEERSGHEPEPRVLHQRYEAAMKKYAPSPATHYSSRDSLFLVVIAVVSLVCGAVSFLAWRVEHNPSLTASMEDDAPSVPLPAGPRKYQ
jgi:hypothetical protein